MRRKNPLADQKQKIMFKSGCIYRIGIFLACSFLFLVNQKTAYAEGIIDSRVTEKLYEHLMVSEKDITRYKHIFRAIEAEDFKAADAEIAKLENDVLMGHVLASKYLSKTYKTNFSELKGWLEKYAGHPQTLKIYRLALRKGSAKDISCPEAEKFKPSDFYSWANTDLKKLNPADKKFVLGKIQSFRKAIGQGKTKVARFVLENPRFKKLVPNRNLDAMAATLATKYLLDNNDKLAFQWASKASKRSKDATASWIAGLAAWRMKQYKTASIYFARLAQSGNKDEWLVAAGAYWAYRANTVSNRKTEAYKWLKIASRYKRTFYGILANYRLGVTLDYNWTVFSYLNDFSQDAYIDEILSSAPIRRAMLLLHIKQPELAERELRYSFREMNDKQKEVSLFIANQYGMHALAVTISNNLKDEERNIAYDALSYPIPEWKPKGGWQVDKALVLALTRQESQFSPKAKSSAGACGLMQLLPSTAAHITKNQNLKKDNSPLLEAEYNMALGQKYVNYLLEKPFIDGNLFFLMTAYNAGPGNLLKWLKKADFNNDPLLFIEVIPARETRIYIERVMANYWIYQSRFGQELTGIKALSKGDWPMLKYKN